MSVSRSITKRILLYLLAAAAVFLMAAAVLPDVQGETQEVRTSSDVRLVVNGTSVTADVMPIIINERTMIPARAVFEQLGGTVSWNEAKQQVTVKLNGHTVVLTILNLNATVDGVVKTMDAVPRLYNGRTLIPIRFVAEALGATVSWDSKTRTASISYGTSQTTTSASSSRSITGVNVSYGTDSYPYSGAKVTANVAMSKSDYSTMTLSNPARYVVDFNNFTGTTASLKTFPANTKSGALVKSVRTAMHTNTQFRLVFDLSAASTPAIALSDDKKSLFITFTENKSSSSGTSTSTTTTTTTTTTTNTSTSTSTTASDSATTVPASNFDPYKDGKLTVCLDPGHGAATAGKRSPDGTLKEYEVNRDIAYRMRDLLKAKGVTVYMTVSDKTSDPSLASRVATANNKNVDIFVSVHANAFGDGENWEDQANGWEIYYYPTSTNGKKLATYIHDANFPSGGGGLGIKDRGIKTANFYVIKYTSMPAVLIEQGFYTSSVEIKKLKSSEWRQKAAQLNVNGIMNFFNSYK
ncbi:MAG: N-acetylmuramoyl-L-alanine amidase [Firmicutes bacterium]|nr:N-acetylmuramoyl-L-alanine amidase [Bacillota bacterium]